MSWFSDLTQGLFAGIKSIGRSLMEVTTPVIQRAMAASHRLVRAIQDGIRNEFRDSPKTAREKIQQDLAETNDRIQKLRQQWQEHGSLSSTDHGDLDHQRQRRKELIKDIEALDRVTTAEDMTEAEGAYKAFEITDAQVHILQYHVGQQAYEGMYNKTCPHCQRPMILRWRDGMLSSSAGFFWGCTGLTATPQCKGTVNLAKDDLNLFAYAKRSEFELSPKDLADYASLKNPKRVIEAIKSIQAATKNIGGIQGYRCPTHGENLFLRESREGKKSLDPLDHFFLGCRHYHYNASTGKNDGCHFVVKLKSAAQLSAILEAGSGIGLMATVDSAGASPPSNRGMRWATIDDNVMLVGFDSGVTIAQLALMLQRSERAVQIRLFNLGKNVQHPDSIAS